MLTDAKDAFRTGEALEELAGTLAEADASVTEIRAMWLRAAAAYEQANALEEAGNARAHADKAV